MPSLYWHRSFDQRQIMETLKSTKAIALATTGLFFVSFLWLMNTKRVNSSLEAALEDEKLKSEELLSEKLLLAKNFQKIKSQLFNLQDRNLELNNVANDTKNRLEAQQVDYTRMKNENRSLAQLKRQQKELLALKSQIENELQTVRSAYEDLVEKNKELTNSVAFLQEKNVLLTGELNKAMFAAVDQSQILAVKRKSEKLTVSAKRTNKIVTNFEVPADLRSLTFRIVDPIGTILSTKNGTIASTITPSEKDFIASSNGEINGNKHQKVEMIFTPNEKLKTGVYTVEILNANLYVVSMKVKLQ